MDWEFINTHLPFYVEAAWLTIRIAAVGIVLSFLIGLIVSIIKYLKLPILIQIADFYVELSRNTPLLVQLFFLYFGLPKIGIVLSSESCAIIGLAFLGGSYMAEAFRSGTLSGLSLGFTKSQIFRHIVLPQAVSTSVPLFLANVIFLIKETSVFSVVALADLMFVAKDLIGIYYKTDEALLMLVLAYLVILLPISIVASYLERRVRYAGFGDTGTISG